MSRKKVERALVAVLAVPDVNSIRLTFLGQLRDARERVDTAISAIEALG